MSRGRCNPLILNGNRHSVRVLVGNMKLQCGYESICKIKNCLNCRRFLKMKTNKITLAEAVCIEDFGTADVSWWLSNRPKEFELAEKVMLKLDKRIVWNEM